MSEKIFDQIIPKEGYQLGLCLCVPVLRGITIFILEYLLSILNKLDFIWPYYQNGATEDDKTPNSHGSGSSIILPLGIEERGAKYRTHRQVD